MRISAGSVVLACLLSASLSAQATTPPPAPALDACDSARGDRIKLASENAALQLEVIKLRGEIAAMQQAYAQPLLQPIDEARRAFETEMLTKLGKTGCTFNWQDYREPTCPEGWKAVTP